MSLALASYLASPVWLELAERVRLGQAPEDEPLIGAFLAESHRLALCAGCGAWFVREASYRLLLATALDGQMPASWRQLCQDYAWQALEELQRLGCASSCPLWQQMRLRSLAKVLDRAVHGLWVN